MEKDINKKLEEISKETGTPVKKLLDLLYYLRQVEFLENNELVSKTGLSKNLLNQIKEDLKSYLDNPSKLTQIKENKKDEIEKIFSSGYTPEEALFSFAADPSYSSALMLLKKYQDHMPVPQRQFDQFIATRDTVAKRIALMNSFTDIAGKRLLFLGDDDFTSLAAAGLSQAKEISVIDIDTRILNNLVSAVHKEHLRIETDVYDIRSPLPKNYLNQFDVVFTDPPYTPDGVKLFLSRALTALDSQNLNARIYLCFGNSDQARERFLPVYNIFYQSGVMIRWAFDKFNRYIGAESIGNASTLYILEPTPKTRLLISGKFNGKLYTNN